MLRRKFLKTSLMAAGGIIVLTQIPLAGTAINQNNDSQSRIVGKPKLNLYGHKRSGCATRPELSAAFEDGFCALPF